MKKLKKVFLFVLILPFLLGMIPGSVSRAEVSSEKQLEVLCRQFTDFPTYHLLYTEQRHFNFNKAKARKDFLTIDCYGLSKKQISKRSIKLFGLDTTGVSPIGGDWGTSAPVLTCKKYVPLDEAGTSYKVYAKLVMHEYETEKDTVIGTAVFLAEKNADSPYGFVMKKAAFKESSGIENYKY